MMTPDSYDEMEEVEHDEQLRPMNPPSIDHMGLEDKDRMDLDNEA